MSTNASVSNEVSALFTGLKGVVGEVLGALRRQMDISLTKASEKSGITETELISVEAGRQEPDLGQFQKLCKALGFDPTSFLHDLKKERDRCAHRSS